MKRIFPDYVYGDGPRQGCWWDETIAAPNWRVLDGSERADVGIIGGGFTGISAALHLATQGVSVALIEAETPGWGASGRNGGFCCLGGAMSSTQEMTRRYGAAAAKQYRQSERLAVDLVERLIRCHDIKTDVHSRGETQLAHRQKGVEHLKRTAETAARDYGVDPVLLDKSELEAEGMRGPFFGGLTIPVGFGLNPQKYLFGLANAATDAGAKLFQQSPVTHITRAGNGHILETSRGKIACDTVIVATNGYSSEDLPNWLAGRYMPAQSTVLVTRPLTESELSRQGWTSDQMAYDTRNLLHYFRLMPDRRFLFGMRGGLLAGAKAENRSRNRVRRDFEKMFPEWREVETPNAWSGMVCLARNKAPFAGPIPGFPGVFAGLAYHGNGVAMGSYCGMLLASIVAGKNETNTVPAVIKNPMRKFPFGRARRIVMPPLYAARLLSDL